MGFLVLDSSPELFVVAPTPGWLWVWELNAPHSSGVEAINWQLKAAVGPAELGFEHTGLEVYGTRVEGNSLKKLAADLCMSRLIVNYLGYSYLDTTVVADAAFSPQYYRLNDIFNWSKYSPQIDSYKVALSITSTSIMINWDRYDLCDGGVKLVSVVKQQQAVVEGGGKGSLGGGAFADDELKKKDARIAELEEELKAKEEELRITRNENEELREENTRMICGLSTVKDKDHEMEYLKKKVASLSACLKEKDAKISFLEARLKGCNARVGSIGMELEEARNTIKSLLENLNKANERIGQKNKEIVELNKELECIRKKLSECQGTVGKKDDEGPSKPGKPRRPQVENPNKVVKERKRGVGHSSFFVADVPLPNRPILGRPGQKLLKFMPVDEPLVAAGPKDIWVHASGKFDTYSWWYVKVMDKEDGEDKMIAFYEGDHSSFNSHGDTIRLPYKISDDFSSEGEFFVAEIEGIGKIFAFVY